MEEEIIISIVSNSKVNVIEESSDSNSSNYLKFSCKRLRLDDNAFLTKFKGVVRQHNGHWGAQIYANHQRVWLGTFKSEKEAAMAYDSAAITLRNGDLVHRNFPWTNDTVQEPIFQSKFSNETILNMIKDGSYTSKFAEFLKNQRREKEIGLNLSIMHTAGPGWYSCKLLFEKELTPSDVGKLNRLVIPKKYAVKYFTNNIVEGWDENTNVQLCFHDRQMRLWKFRYCYWKSSQSYVFTRGWNRFVKEKNLKVNDTLGFYLYNKNVKGSKSETYWIVDIGYKLGDISNGGTLGMEVDLHVGLKKKSNSGLIEEEKEEFDYQKLRVGLGLADNMKKKGFRLFGVQINV